MPEQQTLSRTFTVGEEDTALALGSGSLPVLGTPRVLAWCEALTCDLLDLPEGRTSVGVHVALDHLAASPLGQEVEVTARLVEHEGRRVRFAVEARSGSTMLARGVVERAIVTAETFLARLG